MKPIHSLLLLVTVLSAFVGVWAGDAPPSNVASVTLTGGSPGARPIIPVSHPRLWWSPAHIQTAKQWLAANPFTPSSNDPLGHAMRYVLTGNVSNARTAIQWALNAQITQAQLDAGYSDTARWDAEKVILIYDWCHDQMTDAERQTLLDRWNHYITTLFNGYPNKGPGFQANNYYWGYLRNEILWAIASMHENPQAQSILDHALNTSWTGKFLPYAATDGKGAAFEEGPGYGAVTPWYSLVPFVSLANHGRDLYEETNYFKELVYFTIYATTPAPTTRKVGTSTSTSYEIFPHNEEEYPDKAHVFQDVNRTYYGDYMTVFANKWAGQAVGQYARAWLNLINPQYLSRHIRAIDNSGIERPLHTLPLDYHASGLSTFIARSRWGAASTALYLQLGQGTPNHHFNRDFGSFQLWRNGRWLTRETTEYASNIKGFDNKIVDVSFPEAHNGIMVGPAGTVSFENKGIARAYWRGKPKTLRTQSHADFAYAAVDITQSYQADNYPNLFHNPYVKSVVREYVLLRDIETLVLFDRVEANSVGTVNATDVEKTILFHFENLPQIQNRGLLATNGDQALRIHTLAPATVSYQVVDESNAGQYRPGQHRVEIRCKGDALSHIIHVLQGRDIRGTDLVPILTETDSGYTVQIGNHRVQFQKGATSQGGSVNDTALRTSVQPMEITADGPQWNQ